METANEILGVPVLATLKEIVFLTGGKYGRFRASLGLYHCDTGDERPYLVILSNSTGENDFDHFCVMQDQWYRTYQDALRHYNRFLLDAMRHGRV